MKRFAKWCVCFSVVLMCSQNAWAADSTGATIDRRMLFNAWAFYTQGSYYAANWTHVGPAPASFPSGMKWLLPGTNHIHSAGWKLTACRAGTSAKTSASALLIPPLFYGTSSTNWQASLQNTLDAKIETPFYTEGVGTLYFEAINVDPASPTEITVEIATNMIDHLYAGGPTNVMLTEETEQYTYNWLPLDVLTLNAASTNDLTRYQRILSYREAARVRIRRTGSVYTGVPSLDAMFTAVDNICVSLPPSDVVIRRPEAVFQPGHPAAGTNLVIRCYVDNSSTNDYARTDHAKRTVAAYYRWRYLDQMSNSWASLPLTYVADTGDGLGNGERYEGVLPGQAEVGDLEYYFVCDFDGYRYRQTDFTQTGYTYLTESLSPKTLRGGASEPDGREFYARLRRYSSRFGNMYLDRGTNEAPVEMTLTGDDEWVGMVPLGKGAVTNVAWRFKAVNAYVPDEATFSTNPVYWAEQAQADVGTVPYGGMCVETDGATPIRVTVGEGGYLKVVFNTRTMQFVACRCEYQNFNEWPAPPATFTESGGQPSKQRFINTFDGWSTNVDTRHLEAIVGYPSATNVYWREPVTTLGDWVAGSAKYVSERFEADAVNKPAGTVRLRNLALRLKGGDGTLNLGYVYNHVATRPDGLKQISFKCRLGQPADPYDIAYNHTGFTNKNYLLRANVLGDSSVAPEAPSVSLIAYYTGPDNFYELRMTQIPYTGTPMSDDKSVRLQLFKWVNGVENPLGSPVTRVARLRDRTTAELRIYNTSASSVDIKCKFGATDNVLTVTDGSSPHLKGTFGFLSAECQANFSAVYTQPTTTGAYPMGTATDELPASQPGFDTLQPNWVVPYGRFVCTREFTPYGIYSVTPNQNIGIYLQDSDRNGESEPGEPGTQDWKLMTQVAVPGFGYTLRTVPVYSWQSKFAMLQVMGGGADVIVDEIEVRSWRGQQTPDPEEDGDWLATEAWVVTNSAALGNVVQLDHTRANPDEAQAISSPLLNNGMGMLEFDYKVLRPPAKITVQYASDYDSSNWLPIRSLIVSNAMPAFVHEVFHLRTNAPGYLRVLNDRAGGFTNALVEINNATAWDEPEVGDADWLAYNVKITDTDRERIMLDETKMCSLNNSQTAETDPYQTLYPEAYVKSPRLRWGLGSISFMARAYTNTQSATVSVYATTSADGPRAIQTDWVSITNYTVSGTLFAPYSFMPSDGRHYTAVKLAVPTIPAGGTGRCCLEEITISEPVFPEDFAISNVTLTVEGGMGGGTYAKGQRVTIEADAAPTGYIFERWVGATQYVENITSATTVVTMPASGISLTATYCLSALSMAGGVPIAPTGNTNAVRTVSDNSDGSGNSVRLGGIGLLDDGRTAGIDFIVTGPGVLSFDWKVSSEGNYDLLRFYEVGTGATNQISGTGSEWTRVFVTVTGEPDTVHVFRWEYVKDPVGDYVGEDCGWIDAISWAPFYELTVIGGIGGGAYTNGTAVTITSDAPTAHHQFFRWTGDTNTVADVFSSSTTLSMPSTNVFVTATYTPILYTLSVVNGSGGGTYSFDSAVKIGATHYAGKRFYRWTGDVDTVADVTVETTTVHIADKTLSVFATYSVPLTVNTGTGSGWYPEGSKVTVTADPDPLYMEFGGWTGDAAGLLADPTLRTTTLSIPTGPASLTAVYRNSIARVAGCYGRTFTSWGTSDGVSADTAASSPSGTPAVKLGGSGVVPDNGFAAFETVVNGSGTVTFWWKVSSESDADYLTFKLDGIQVAAISGTKGSWAQVSNRVEGAGVTHTLRWEYVKNGSLNSSIDAGWVDDIIWTGDIPDPVIRPDIRTATATNNTFAFTFHGERGIPYTIYSNAALSAWGWAPMATVPQERGETNGVFRFEATVFPPFGQHSGFYRVIGGME